MKRLISSSVFASLVLGVLCFASYAEAGNIPSEPVTIQIFGEDATGELPDQISSVIEIEVDGVTGDFGVTNLSPGDANAPLWDVEFLNVSGNIDPFVTLNFSVTNTAATPTILTFVTTLPTGPLGPATLIGGSTSGTVGDTNGSGFAEISPALGLPLYEGQIDGGTILPLLIGSTTTVTTTGLTDVIGPDSAGLPGPSIPGPAVGSTIGLTQTFLLTPGDSATFTSTFFVEPVPEPSAILLAFGAFAVCVGARRKARS